MTRGIALTALYTTFQSERRPKKRRTNYTDGNAAAKKGRAAFCTGKSECSRACCTNLRNRSNNLRTQSGELYCSPLQTARPATFKVQGKLVSLAQSMHSPRCGGELLRLVGMKFLAEKTLLPC